MDKLNNLIYGDRQDFTVFLSHSISDQELIKSIYEESIESGINLYIAERKPKYEVPIIEKIEQHLDSSHCVLVLYTKEACRSPFVNMEIGRATSMGKPIVTVLDKGVKLSGWLYGYETIQLNSETPRNSFKKAFNYIKSRIDDWTLAKREYVEREELQVGITFPLPELPWEFTGRTKEIEKIVSILKENRIVVIKGLSGIGKTSLAIKVAKSISGIVEKKNKYFMKGDELQLILGHESRRREFLDWISKVSDSLLIFDEFSILKESARNLILERPLKRNKVLITAEDIEISYLKDPTYFLIGPLTKGQSIKLFDRLLKSAGLSLDRSLSQKICEQLEGFPLAIKLATSQISAGFPPEMLQKSLSHKLFEPVFAMLNHSYGNLTNIAKSMLLKLSSISSSISVSIIEKVAGQNINALANLSLNGFVRIQGGNCELYKIIREFALSKLTPRKRAKYEDEIKPYILTEIEELLGKQSRVTKEDKNDLLIFLPALSCEALCDLLNIFTHNPGLMVDFNEDFKLRLELLVENDPKRSRELWDKLNEQEEAMLRKEEDQSRTGR